ncbi:MAG: lytic transglycosylase domain-containing protein [Bdellovibrionales bacterium]|nr:lytic transglycosylase domain-containing protein [Bdellovibrionales bacterium]
MLAGFAQAASKKPPETPVADAAFSPPQFPTPETIAAEMGVSVADLPKLVDDFASALSLGMKSKQVVRICARDEQLCQLIRDYFSQSEESRRERRRQRYSRRAIRLTERNVAEVQGMDFQRVVGGLRTDEEKRFLQAARLALRHEGCPRNLSSALVVKGEEHYVNPEARARLEELFAHASKCMDPSDVAWERIHLRRGLFALNEGDQVRAVELLRKALEAKTPKERYRPLYWLGRIEWDKSKSPIPHWDDLLKEFPMSFYAIDASVKLGKDPMTVVASYQPKGFHRKTAGEEELNREILWLEALYTYKKFGSVGRWATWIVRSEDELPVEALNYISALKVASGLYRSNIQMLFGYFRKNPEAVNSENLQMLFPRPYYEIIEEASRDKIDQYLVYGLMRQESGFDPRAVSRARAKGLMQIIPSTARRLASNGARRLFNEKDNTMMGVKYLTRLAERFGGEMELVFAAYNAGPMKVEEWLKRNPKREDPILWNDMIPFMETRDYVVSILRNAYFYTRLYGDEAGSPKDVYRSRIVQGLVARN